MSQFLQIIMVFICNCMCENYIFSLQKSVSIYQGVKDSLGGSCVTARGCERASDNKSNVFASTAPLSV